MPRSILVLTCLMPSCGDAGGGTTGTTATTGASTSVTTTGETTTTDIVTTSGPSTTGAGPTDGTSSTTAETTGGAETVQYKARYSFGAQSSIVIRKLDVAADRCTTLFIREQGQPMGFSVDLPGAWEIESAYVTQDATICFDLGMANKDPVYADYGTGTASWTPEEAYCPENGITLDVTLTFPPGPEWVPAEDTMAVTGLDAKCA